MRGTGRTVFSGSQVEDFQVEVLGVLENAGPKQSIILGRLSGGPLERTGVMQGMSGSPVYIGGKLVGAVALAFSFAKEPIAGIRPIEEMMSIQPGEPQKMQRAALDLRKPNLLGFVPKPLEASFGDAKLTEIATPVSFGGFTKGTLDYFLPQLRAIGLEPRQGVSGGGRPVPASTGSPTVEPGAMISVQLLTGDLTVGADGTVTHVDGKRIYAFGHRFLSVGSTELPFARAEVLALLPNLSTSFKISTARQWLGTITGDYSTAILGELGRRPNLVPVNIGVRRAGTTAAMPLTYSMEMVNDQFLSPLLLQMAIFSTIDATERTVGASSFAIRGELQFDGNAVHIDNIFSGDIAASAQASVSAAIPLAYALQSGLDSLKLKSVEITIDAFDEKKQLQVDQVWASRREVRPGEQVEISAVLAGDNGREVTRTVAYRIPEGMTPGTLFFTVADGTTTNVTEYQQWIGRPQRSPAEVVRLLNALRGNTRAYVRIWRGDPGFQIEGKDLPDPPPSLALILGRQQSLPGVVTATAGSKIGEIEIDAGAFAISGSKTIQVEVKE